MSLNDKDTTLYGAHGADVYPGVTNPTKSSQHSDPLAANFVRLSLSFLVTWYQPTHRSCPGRSLILQQKKWAREQAQGFPVAETQRVN